MDRQRVRVPLDQLSGLDHELAQAWARRDRDLQLVASQLLGRGLGFRHERVVRIDPGLALGLASPGGEVDPLELSLETSPAGRVRLLLAGPAGVASVRPGGRSSPRREYAAPGHRREPTRRTRAQMDG